VELEGEAAVEPLNVSPPLPRRRRGAARGWAATLLLLWAAGSFSLAARQTLAEWRARADFRGPAYAWRFGTPRAEGQAGCLAGVAAMVPAGSRLALLDPHWDSFFRWRWAAYRLAGHDVVDAAAAEAAAATFLVAMGDQQPLRGTLIAGGPGCRLYRLP
jgi:hypothetical protein